MANYIDKLDDQDGNVIYPITLTKAVYKEDTASTVDDLLAAKLDASAYTASDALSKIKTVDGPGSGLDADKLDGNEASAFALSGHTHTLSGITDITATAAEVNVLDGITATVTELNYVDGATSNIQTQLNAKLANSTYTASDVLAKLKTVDGAGSGIDADLLDGKEASAFSLTGHTHTLSNISDVTATAPEINVLDGITASTTELNYTDGVTSNIQTQLNAKLASSAYTASDVLTKMKTVDGSGSGIDADLLDGQEGSYYLDWANTTNKPDPVITLAGDLSGSVTLTDLASGTLTATIVANSVVLGTDTTGNYVAGLTAGNGVSITGTAGEGWSPTVTLDTPSTLTTATTNAVTADSHTHAITTTTTAAINAIVSTDANGNIRTANAYYYGATAYTKYNATTKSIDFIFV